MPLVATSLRFALDQTRRDIPMENIGTDPAVVVWQGEPLEVQAALFDGNPSVAANLVTDLSNIASITLTLRRYSPNGALLLSKTINSPFASIVFANWTDGSSQQFDFNLSATETNFALPSDGTMDIYGAFSVATNSGVSLTVGVFSGILASSGATGVGSPPVPATSYYTKSEVDAKFNAFIGQAPEPPAGPAGGVLGGVYPNPGFASATLTTIAAQSNTSYGIGLLVLSNTAAALTYLGLVKPQNAPVVTHQFLSGFNATTGAFTQQQPLFADLSGVPTTVAGYGISDALTTGAGANQGVLTTDARLSDARNANSIQTLTSHQISTSTDPTDGQTLVFNSTTSKWQCGTLAGGGGGGGTPGGSTGQLQYNNTGALGGLATMTTDGSVITAQMGTKFLGVDPTDVTKKFQFDLSNVAAGSTRVMTVPNVNAAFAQPFTAVTHQFLTGMSGMGLFSSQQPAFTDLSGSVTAAQMPALTGDVQSTIGTVATVLKNIPSTTPLVGYLQVTAIGAPAAPAAGFVRAYVDSTALNWCSKNASGIVCHGMQSQTPVASNWIRGINDDGSVVISRPAETDLTFTDVTTNNVSTTAHGFVPKLPNDSTLYLNGLGNWVAPSSPLLFVGTGTKTVANTTTETTLMTTGVGSLTLPANYFTVGSVIKLETNGIITTAGTQPNFTLRFKIGAATPLSDTALLTASQTNYGWGVDLTVTCITTGTSGTLQVQGWWYVVGGALRSFFTGNTSLTTINTTTTNVIDLTATWGAASVSNSITTDNVVLYSPGSQGPQGPAGTNGAAGAVWRDGAGVPSSGLGVNGDYYLNDTTGDVYTKSGGTYSLVANMHGANGAVTSVGLAMPTEFSVSNSPVITSGILTAGWATQTTNKVFVSPNGSTGVPTFRALATADLPTGIPIANLAANSITIQGSAVTLGSATLATTANPQFATLGLGVVSNTVTVLQAIGPTINTNADNVVALFDSTWSLTKNDTNTRTFYGSFHKVTLNTGGSNTNTTVNVLAIDTTNTAITGVTTNLLRLSYGGTMQMNVASDGTLDIKTGFKINGAATTANVLRGDGTRFVSSTLAAADLSNGVSGSGLVLLQSASTSTNLAETQQPLTDGATINWDMNSGGYAKVTLGGNRTLANPTNTRNGAIYVLEVIQDATGGRTLAYGANFIWSAGTAPTLTTNATRRDFLTFFCSNGKLYGLPNTNYV